MDQTFIFQGLMAELRRWTAVGSVCVFLCRPERATKPASSRLRALPLSDDRVISQRWRRGLLPGAGPPVAHLLNVIGDTMAATRHPSLGRWRRMRVRKSKIETRKMGDVLGSKGHGMVAALGTDIGN